MVQRWRTRRGADTVRSKQRSLYALSSATADRPADDPDSKRRSCLVRASVRQKRRDRRVVSRHDQDDHVRWLRHQRIRPTTKLYPRKTGQRTPAFFALLHLLRLKSISGLLSSSSASGRVTGNIWSVTARRRKVMTFQKACSFRLRLRPVVRGKSCGSSRDRRNNPL